MCGITKDGHVVSNPLVGGPWEEEGLAGDCGRAGPVRVGEVFRATPNTPTEGFILRLRTADTKRSIRALSGSLFSKPPCSLFAKEEQKGGLTTFPPN